MYIIYEQLKDFLFDKSMFFNKTKSIRWIFNIAITLILLAILLIKIKPTELINTLESTNFYLLLLSIPIVVALWLVRALKWRVMLNHLGIKKLTRESLRIILIGSFYGMMTPGKVGELARAYYMKEKKAVIVPTIIWEKISDILTLVVLSVLALLLFFKNTGLIYIILAMAFLLIIGLAIITNKRILGQLAKIFKFSEESKQYYLSSMTKMANLRLLSKIFLLSFTYYGLAYLLAAVVLLSLDPSINLLLAFSLPIIVLVGNAPITISGLGLREFAAVLTFETFGTSTSYGFSFTMILFLLVTLIPAIIGYLLIIRGRTNRQLNGLLSRRLERWRYSQISRWLQGKNVLDVGCGTGSFLHAIPSGMIYMGVDMQQEVIDEAKELNKYVNFVKVNVGKEKIKLNEKYDNIVLSAVLEHLEQPEKVIEELKNNLSKHGHIIITTPTNKAEKILRIGSRVGIFSSSALEDHKQPLLEKNQLISMVEKTGYIVEYYNKFELGLNQIIVIKKP